MMRRVALFWIGVVVFVPFAQGQVATVPSTPPRSPLQPTIPGKQFPKESGSALPWRPQPLQPAAVPTQAPPPRGALTPDLGGIGERLYLSWHLVQVKQEGRDWKLVCGSDTLAEFGADERSARRALDAVRYYRFTELRRIGTPRPVFTFYLINGQAPHGVMFGMHSEYFNPDKLTVGQVGNDWVIQDGKRALFHFGDKAEEARQALEVIRQHKFDRVCRIGQANGLTFLVRTR